MVDRAPVQQQPTSAPALVADPTLIPKAVEEILRIEAAVVPGRRATATSSSAACSIAKDDQLILMLCSANRDPAEFADPERSRLRPLAQPAPVVRRLDRTVAWVLTSRGSS